MKLEPGTRLGDYEVLSPLGTGAMGEVMNPPVEVSSLLSLENLARTRCFPGSLGVKDGSVDAARVQPTQCKSKSAITGR